MHLFGLIISVVVSLHLVCAQKLPHGNPTLHYCRGFTDPHFITFFDSNRQLCTDLGWQTMLENPFVRVSIEVADPEWVIQSFTIDIKGGKPCTIDFTCLKQQTCCANNPGVNVVQINPNEYLIDYQGHTFVHVEGFHFPSNSGHRFNIDLWQPITYVDKSCGICIKGCVSSGVGRRKRHNGGEVCQQYQEAAVDAASAMIEGAQVTDIAQRNAATTCRFDVEATGDKEIARDSVDLILISVVNAQNPSLETLPESIKQVSIFKARAIEKVEAGRK